MNTCTCILKKETQKHIHLPCALYNIVESQSLLLPKMPLKLCQSKHTKHKTMMHTYKYFLVL